MIQNLRKEDKHIANYSVNTLREFLKFIHVGAERVSTFGGMEWWNGIVEWTTGTVECFIGHI